MFTFLPSASDKLILRFSFTLELIIDSLLDLITGIYSLSFILLSFFDTIALLIPTIFTSPLNPSELESTLTIGGIMFSLLFILELGFVINPLLPWTTAPNLLSCLEIIALLIPIFLASLVNVFTLTP